MGRIEIQHFPFGADTTCALREALAELSASSSAIPRDSGLQDTISPAVQALSLDPAFIYVADSRQRARALQDTLLREGQPLPSGYWGTVDAIVEQLAARAAPDLVPVSPLVERLLIEQAMGGEPVSGRTHGRGPAPGAVTMLAEALRRARVALPPDERDHLLRTIESRAGSAMEARIRRVRDTLDAVNVRLRGMSRVAPDDLEWLMIPRLDSALAGLRLLIVDDIYRLGPAQAAFLAACAARVDRTLVLTRGSNSKSPAEAVLARRDDFSGALGKATRRTGPDSLAPERRRVLNAALGVGQGAPDMLAQAQVTIAPALSPRQEVHGAIRRINELHLREGVALDRIGVCFVAKEAEREAQLAFELAGVPVSGAGTASMLSAPPVAALLELAQAVADGAEREVLLAALRSPYLEGLRACAGIPTRAGASLGDELHEWRGFVDDLAWAARKARVVGGAISAPLETQWIERIDTWLASTGAKGHLDRRAGSRAHDSEPGNGGAPRGDDRFAMHCRTLFDRLLPLSRRLTLAELLDTLLSLAAAAGVEARCQLDCAAGWPLAELPGIARWNREAWWTFRRMLEELREGLRAIAPGYRTPARIALGDLRERLAGQWLPAPGCDGRGVRMMGMLDVRAVPVDYLFVCGLIDGALPFPDPENLYFPHRLETHMSALTQGQCAALLGDVDPLEGLRHLFACALVSGGKELRLSMARMDGGRECAPALPLIELLEHCGLGDALTIALTSAPDGTRSGAGIPLAADVSMEEPPGSLHRRFPAAFDLSALDRTANLEPLGPSGLQFSLSDAVFRGIELASAPVDADWYLPALAGMECSLMRDDAGRALSPFEGAIDGEALAALGPADSAARRMSPTAIETYAECPMKYAFKYVLGIEEPTEITDDATPVERGNALHATFERFCLHVRKVIASDRAQALETLPRELREGLNAAGIAPETLPLLKLDLFERIGGVGARETLRVAFDECVEGFDFPSANWQRWCARARTSLGHEPLMRSELSLWLQRERAWQQRGVFPWLAEHNFGKRRDGAASGHAPLILRDSQGQPLLTVSGSIDRVDIAITGEGPPMLIVRDYKSGVSRYAEAIKLGRKFQLPLYMLAALDVAPGCEPGGFFYHKLSVFDGKPVVEGRYLSERAAGLLLGDGAPLRGNTLNSLRDPVAHATEVLPERIGMLLRAMRKGRFHPTLADGTSPCGHCHYRSVCAMREGKQAALQQDRERLTAIAAYAPWLIEEREQHDGGAA